MPNETTKVENDIYNERARQDEKWGEQNHLPSTWLLILIEEVVEASESLLKENDTSYREEMIHVAAVAIAALESFDRLGR